MKYIETVDNEVREYEIVFVDLEQYKKIIKVLDEKCSIVKRITKVTANTGDEAIKKINHVNTSGIKIVNVIHNSEVEYDGLEGQNMYEIEYYAKTESFLGYLLKTLLMSYETNADLSSTINLLLDYENSDEMKDLINNMKEKGITPELYSKYELLKESSIAAIGCIEKALIKTTINCNDRKVYKLGER